MNKQQRQPRILSDRNVSILFDVARYQLLSTKQIYTLYFAEGGSDPTAAAKLLARLEAAGYLAHTKTYGKTRRTAHGLSETRPDKVWYFPPNCQKRLKTDLSSLGRVSEFNRFLDHVKVYNKDQTFSDQLLPHELGINSCLIALEKHFSNTNYRDLFWIRTSPQHSLTSATVWFKNADGYERRGTINPDAVIFFRAYDGEVLRPNFFFLEFESGTKDGYEYRADKIVPYRAYMHQGRSPKKRDERTRYFDEVGQTIIDGWGLPVSSETTPTFRVLTISRERVDAIDQFTASCAIPTEQLFLFTDLQTFIDNPYGDIWFRRKEFSTAGLLDEYADRDQKYFNKQLTHSVFLKWKREVVENLLPKVAIP